MAAAAVVVVLVFTDFVLFLVVDELCKEEIGLCGTQGRSLIRRAADVLLTAVRNFGLIINPN